MKIETLETWNHYIFIEAIFWKSPKCQLTNDFGKNMHSPPWSCLPYLLTIWNSNFKHLSTSSMPVHSRDFHPQQNSSIFKIVYIKPSNQLFVWGLLDSCQPNLWQSSVFEFFQFLHKAPHIAPCISLYQLSFDPSSCKKRRCFAVFFSGKSGTSRDLMIYTMIHIWLVVSTYLKNISQNGNLPQIGVNMKNIWNHHPDICILYIPIL